jgi:hypothetical protein
VQFYSATATRSLALISRPHFDRKPLHGIVGVFPFIADERERNLIHANVDAMDVVEKLLKELVIELFKL